MKKTKLFLHIGHGKTGTSAIQSALAIASEDLAKRGINYPIQQSLRDRASRLEITSGNWEPTSEASLTNQLLEIAKSNYKNSKIILSSESLFWLVPELIQNAFKAQTLNEALEYILSKKGRQQQLDDYQRLQSKIGPEGASDRVASLIFETLSDD